MKISKIIKNSITYFSRRVLLDYLDFLFKKESPEKKTSIKNETKVNSVSFLDYRFVLSALFIFILNISNIVLSNSVLAESVPTTVNIKPSLSITLPSNTLTLPLDPSNNDFGTVSTNITVATNHPNGYKLYLSSDNTDLINTTNNTYKIPTLESSASESNFPANYWGYKLGTTETNYLPYASNTLISESNEATNGISSTISFAAKVDYTKPAGLYSLSFNLKTIPIVTQTYMQDMTNPTIANQVCKTESPSIVIDSRDEQAYMIQRLDDGKCWMLDNLNLDLTNKTIVDNLTTANTHVDANSLISLKQGYRSQCITDGGSDCDRYATSGLIYANWVGGSSFSVPLVNKYGDCYIAGPSATITGCTYDGSYTSNTILSTLTSEQSVFGLGSGKIGMFYNFCAASAGSYCFGNNSEEGSDAVGDAEYDICPAHWRLPTGGLSGEVHTLCDVIKGETCAARQNMIATNYDSMQYKLAMPLSGFFRVGRAWKQGYYGVFISSTDIGSGNMESFLSYPGVFESNVSMLRDRGNSVRCLLNES